MAARRNSGVQERRARLMQLGERAYLCQALLLLYKHQSGHDYQNNNDDDDDDEDDGDGEDSNNIKALRLVDLPEMELRRFLSDAKTNPTRHDLSQVLEDFATSLQVQSQTTDKVIVCLEISQRIQEILEDVNREAFLSILSKLNHLRHITLGSVTMEILHRLQVSGCTSHVESLHTECFHVAAPEEETAMINLLSHHWTSLKRLTWKTSSYRRAAQIRFIGQTVPSLSQLQHLHLTHTGLKEFHPFEALQFIKKCPVLQDLVLNNWKLPAIAGTFLADGFIEHSNLQRLELSRCEVDERGWNSIMTSLAVNNVLREFSFAETRILRATGGPYPSRIIWERLADLLEDHNHTLQRIENANMCRVCRLLELNRSNFRQNLEDVKLGSHLLAMASHSPHFLYSVLHKNLETLLVRGDQELKVTAPT
eukprot:scaffold5068_cov146-Amphora_coffeaeformis.AAC.2